ncbi:MAG TPA: serine/threonine-protein kinase [Candidatus Krumholzibacteria bacterium]|nr:serine/threonine-protein kinase [Candidatus Krumholzibacteria bacterium]
MLAGRYRVVALLGRGGMGEVYRADDLKLGQQAALKFLPPALERDEARLGRFLNEVRVSLRVSHPSVCRVHDVGEADGQHFLSMEYVDGENLGSLLRRVGHLPQERAVQVAQQLCAGLAAAHEQGVLHRDLKPANVMIDGRGQVKITDFGLASLMDELPSDIRSGTPAYMAPEQWSGQTIGVHSDIYALGLVLYELFTGKPVFAGRTPEEAARLHRDAEPTSPASLVEDLDPAVERVIMHCLEKDPEDRPASVRAVAAALPGGNPLAAALEAGEIPSPELVALAQKSGTLRPALAWALLAAVLLFLGANIFLGGRTLLVRRVPLEKSPQVLEAQARQLLVDLGYTAPPVDAISEFVPNLPYIEHLDRAQTANSTRWSVLRQAQPAALRFWYRQSPRLLVRKSAGSIGDWMDDPEPTFPGEVRVALDTQGRLIWLQAVPPDSAASDSAARRGPWQPLLQAAGFEAQHMRAVEPSWTPPVFADERAAWIGSYPEAPETAIRVEAASYQGRPVSFRIIEPWNRPAVAPPLHRSFWKRASEQVETGWFLVVMLGASFVAWRNVRLGRGDRKGALRLALYLGALRLLWMFGQHHLPSQDELTIFMANLAWACYRICVVWVFYLAFEPYARRLWPHMMVSWVRLLKGRWRDPLVGRDLMVGLLFGLTFALVVRGSILLPGALGGRIAAPEHEIWTSEALRGTRFVLSSMAGLHTQAVLSTFTGILFLLVLKLLVRKTRLACVLFVGLAVVMFNPNTGEPIAFVASMLVICVLFFLVLFRFGFLPIMLGFTVSDLVRAMPLTFDLSAWYAQASLFPILLLVGLALYGMRAAIAGQSLFHDPVFDARAVAKP